MITLYDIPSKLRGICFSPNVFKARLSLAFKGLSFRTIWLEIPEIEPQMKKLGAAPTTTKPDGSPKYTVPVIHDETTGKIISDSLNIAEYLEATYPDGPSLFPQGAHAPIHLFNVYFFPTVIRPGFLVFLSNIMFNFNPPTMEAFRGTREPLFGKTLEEAVPKGEEREKMVAATRAEFSKLAAMYAANGRSGVNGGESKPYFFGGQPSYADIIVVSYLIWIRVGLSVADPEWKEINEEWDGGKWGKLLGLLERYDIRT